MSANGTIAQLFIDQANKHGQNTAFLYRQNKTGYQPMSWSSLFSLVNDIAFGLAAINLELRQKCNSSDFFAYFLFVDSL